MFTVLGFLKSKWQQNKNNPQYIHRRPEYITGQSEKKVIGLFYDQNLPERQEVIDVNLKEMQYHSSLTSE